MQEEQQDPERITYGALLKKGEETLNGAEVSEARLDAWLLLEYAAGISRAWYFAHAKEPADGKVQKKYLELVKKRAQHIPVQHLTHQAFFMGYEFYVDERVLVPRQDTEVLVELALSKKEGNLRILDMCTGSGCILLSILAENQAMTGVGADLSSDALAVARKNAERLSLKDRAVFVESDLFSSAFFMEKDGKTPEKYDMLISNPPYIPTAQISSLMEEVRLHDPRMALDGRDDGLYFYREITRRAPEFLKPGGWLLFEIGYDQGTAVGQILTERGFTEVSVHKDLAGLDRVVTGRLGRYV